MGASPELSRVVGCAFLLVGPLAVWWLCIRDQRPRIAVAVALAVLDAFVLAVDQGWLLRRARWEAWLLCAPTALAIVLVGLLIQRRTRAARPTAPSDAPQPPPRGRHTRSVFPALSRRGMGAVAVLVAYLPAALLLLPMLAFMVLSEPFVPSAAEALPLPPGLRVIHDSATDGTPACSSGLCSRDLLVTDVAAAPPDAVLARVRTSLERDHGWHFDATDSSCRRNGLLFDSRQVCVSVSTVNGHTLISLAGSRIAP